MRPFKQALDEADLNQTQFRQIVKDLTGYDLRPNTVSQWSQEKEITGAGHAVAIALCKLLARQTPEQEQPLPETPETLPTPKQERLVSWLVATGGIMDEGGEITHAIGSARARPGLINNKSGRNLDDATLYAWEQGFIGTPQDSHGFALVDRPTTDDLIYAIREDMAGRQITRESDCPF